MVDLARREEAPVGLADAKDPREHLALNGDRHLELLKDEYVMLQQFYEDIDRRSLTIKGWSITVATATTGAALLFSRDFCFALLLTSLLFWYLEGFLVAWLTSLRYALRASSSAFVR